MDKQRSCLYGRVPEGCVTTINDIEYRIGGIDRCKSHEELLRSLEKLFNDVAVYNDGCLLCEDHAGMQTRYIQEMESILGIKGRYSKNEPNKL